MLLILRKDDVDIACFYNSVNSKLYSLSIIFINSTKVLNR
ncbi:Uncharacterized protein dnl_31870 [Desulfonema limicola]|uniref:Uncharacterized protein n=1 Tax=Desulfonema limicola TaxID=45656 RepID=A0A975B8Q9_9BACT|nr:Uncharacterized protein dnl_31870 [Desulfonema limicola]